MYIIIESHIPFAQGVMERMGHRVSYLPPEAIDRESVRHADALVVRTRTRCDGSLLAGSSVRHIATATIGLDHIDLDYCRLHGIKVTNAPGCNAPAVAQYVLSTVGRLRPDVKRLGIVGVGHVGGIVDRWAAANGMRTMLCDPPRALAEGNTGFYSLDEIAAECDVVTFHVPLDATTRHMIDRRWLEMLSPGSLVINASRGGVASTQALLDNPQLDYAIDCWEGEPTISPLLLQRALVATPHIAGYSLQGKQRATAMALKAIDTDIAIECPAVSPSPSLEAIIQSYDPLADTARLRQQPLDFEKLRNRYSFRPEP